MPLRFTALGKPSCRASTVRLIRAGVRLFQAASIMALRANPVAHLRDPALLASLARGVFARTQAQVTHQLRRAGEPVQIAQLRHQRRAGQQRHPAQTHQRLTTGCQRQPATTLAISFS